MWFKDSILLAATVSAAHTGIRHATTVLECLMKQSNEWVFREKQLAAPGGGWARSVSVADLSTASSISMSVIPARNTRHAITDSTPPLRSGESLSTRDKAQWCNYRQHTLPPPPLCSGESLSAYAILSLPMPGLYAKTRCYQQQQWDIAYCTAVKGGPRHGRMATGNKPSCTEIW